MFLQKSKVIFLTIILAALYIRKACAVKWMEESLENMFLEEPKNELITKSDCVEDMEQTNTDKESKTKYVRKKQYPSYNILKGDTKVIPLYHKIHHRHCSCEMDFQPLELGRHYYPRFLQTGTCKADSCGEHRKCLEKKYNIKVLRQKQLEDENKFVNFVALPKSLREYWTSETITVAVACECIPDIYNGENSY